MRSYRFWAAVCPLVLLCLSPHAEADSQSRREQLRTLVASLPADPAWPARVPANVELVYRYAYDGGSLEITNAYPNGASLLRVSRDDPFSAHPLPDYVVVGDGALSGRMILIDKRPGSRLSRLIDRVEAQILAFYGLKSASELWPETLENFLATHTSDYLDYPALGTILDPAPGVTAHVRAQATSLTHGLQGDALGSASAPIPHYLHPVRPYEDALRAASGICIDMALFSSLLLERFGVAHRVVFGSVVSASDDSQSNGHTWVELADGRILDPTWKTLAAPDEQMSADHPDWRYFGNAQGKQYRFGYPAVPILRLAQ